MESYHPARRINNRNGLSKVIGLFSSKKMNVQIAWESQLERDFCYLLEFDKNIEKYFFRLRALILLAQKVLHLFPLRTAKCTP